MKLRTSLAVASAFFALTAGAVELVDLVNPEIGNISHMLVPTFPTTQLPNGMYRFCAPGQSFADDRIPPLPLFIPAHRGRGLFTVHPAAGEDAFAPWRGTWDKRHGLPHLSSFSFDEEDVDVMLAPTEKGAVARFSFLSSGRHALVFETTSSSGTFSVEGTTLQAVDHMGALPLYLQGVFNPAPVGSLAKGRRLALFFGEDPLTVELRFAISAISSEQARRSLDREIGTRSLEEISSAARAAWNAKLGKIRVEGGTPDEQCVFYTALYRVYERMVNCTEDGRYRGYDREVHATEGVDYYCDDWTWDTYRAAHPLMCLLEPAAQTAKLTSYLRMARENKEGWVPLFPVLSGDRHGMNGFHPPALFLDAWRKGVTGVDWSEAFRALAHTERTSTRLPWNRGPRIRLDDFHDEHGYFPALNPTPNGGWADDPDWPAWAKHNERRQSVAVTLAYSYDCWCLAELARDFGTKEDVAEFTRKSRFFRNLWNEKTGFFHPKDETGAFIMPFDYNYSGGQGARDYYDENNAWTYIWDVQHALPELVEMLGGKRAASAKLDRMFNEPYRRPRWEFYRVLPDSTGNMGMFTMGNEPSFHIPYMYNFTGEPWKTQKLVRKILKAWFRNDLMGMCGDEDGGGMSAFAVFSMMGFYPVTPGIPEYQWGSPVFRKVTIHLENGKDFVLEAPAASEDAKYIRGIRVNGVRTEGACSPLRHADVVNGTVAHVEMSTRPFRQTAK